MRPKHLHAAESGVGKHITRESERAQACAAGKERVANAHSHKLAPEASKLPGPFLCPEIGMRATARNARAGGLGGRSRFICDALFVVAVEVTRPIWQIRTQAGKKVS
jgi:hypothetical protein